MSRKATIIDRSLLTAPRESGHIEEDTLNLDTGRAYAVPGIFRAGPKKSHLPWKHEIIF